MSSPNKLSARQRPSWSRYAAELAKVASRQSEDPYVQVGAAVLRKNNTVAGLGFNGPPAGVDIDWSDRDRRRPLIVHAEKNALRHSVPMDVKGGLIVSTHRPCASCMTDIASYGIKRVYFLYDIDPINYNLLELDRVTVQFGMEVHRISG